MAWRRFFDDISYVLNDPMVLHCDNLQTIRLLKSEDPLLTTKLRHVDIHQHWLRQEVQAGTVNIEWTSTTTMKADGLTKSLPRQPFERFIRQLNLVDVQGVLAQRQRSGRVC